MELAPRMIFWPLIGVSDACPLKGRANRHRRHHLHSFSTFNYYHIFCFRWKRLKHYVMKIRHYWKCGFQKYFKFISIMYCKKLTIQKFINKSHSGFTQWKTKKMVLFHLEFEKIHKNFKRRWEIQELRNEEADKKAIRHQQQSLSCE